MAEFEDELRKLFEQTQMLNNITFTGRICYGWLDEDLRVKIEFVQNGTHNRYEGLKVTLLNRTEGRVDSLTLLLQDILGRKTVNSSPQDRGVYPNLWDHDGGVRWDRYQPNDADRQRIVSAVNSYLDVFRAPASPLVDSPLPFDGLKTC